MSNGRTGSRTVVLPMLVGLEQQLQEMEGMKRVKRRPQTAVEESSSGPNAGDRDSWELSVLAAVGVAAS